MKKRGFAVLARGGGGGRRGDKFEIKSGFCVLWRRAPPTRARSVDRHGKGPWRWRGCQGVSFPSLDFSCAKSLQFAARSIQNKQLSFDLANHYHHG